MMLKKSVYPKTSRIRIKEVTFEVTEKLDGSNLANTKLNGELLICQRK